MVWLSVGDGSGHGAGFVLEWGECRVEERETRQGWRSLGFGDHSKQMSSNMRYTEVKVKELRIQLKQVEHEREIYRRERDEARLEIIRIQADQNTMLEDFVRGSNRKTVKRQHVDENEEWSPVKYRRVECNVIKSVVRKCPSQQENQEQRDNIIYNQLKELVGENGLDPQILLRHPEDNRRSKILDGGWLNTSFPQHSALLILSDSVLRQLDSKFSGDSADVFVFGGMTSVDLLPILFQLVTKGVTSDRLVLCFGANDVLKGCTKTDAFVQKDIQNIIYLARHISTDVILCNIYECGWKQKSKVKQQERETRRQALNQYVRESVSGNGCQLLDLETIFQGKTGRPTESDRGWYMADSVHPNLSGIVAIEVCLQQAICGQPVQRPSPHDVRLFINPQQRACEIQRRTTLMGKNRQLCRDVLHVPVLELDTDATIDGL